MNIMCMVLKKAQRSQKAKMRLYDLESYSVISLSSIAQWKLRWLSPLPLPPYLFMQRYSLNSRG